MAIIILLNWYLQPMFVLKIVFNELKFIIFIYKLKQTNCNHLNFVKFICPRNGLHNSKWHLKIESIMKGAYSMQHPHFKSSAEPYKVIIHFPIEYIEIK